MKSTVWPFPDDESLQETAARLLHVSGLKNVIYACRSN